MALLQGHLSGKWWEFREDDQNPTTETWFLEMAQWASETR